MSSLIRPRLFAAATLLLMLGAGWLYLGSAKADDRTSTADGDAIVAGGSERKQKPSDGRGREAAQQAGKRAGALAAPASGSVAQNLILGSKDSAQPENIPARASTAAMRVIGCIKYPHGHEKAARNRTDLRRDAAMPAPA